MQRYAHMRRSNVERAFQIHFDDCCYVCQPKLKGSRAGINKAALKTHTQAVFCLVSTTSSEVRNDAVAVDKKRTRLCSVSTFMEKLAHRLVSEHLRLHGGRV